MPLLRKVIANMELHAKVGGSVPKRHHFLVTLLSWQTTPHPHHICYYRSHPATPVVSLLISNENGSLSGFFCGKKGRMGPHTAKHHHENASFLLPFCASRLTGWRRDDEGSWHPAPQHLVQGETDWANKPPTNHADFSTLKIRSIGLLKNFCSSW